MEADKIDSAGEFYAEQLGLGLRDGYRKVLWLGRNTIGEVLPTSIQESMDREIESNRLSTLAQQEQLDMYLEDQGSAKGFIMNLTGGLARNITDPVAMAINMIPGGIFVNVSLAAGEYAFDEYTLYNRNVINDFDASKDIAGLATSVGMAALGSTVAKKTKMTEGVPLWDITLEKYNKAGQKVATMKDSDMKTVLKDYGIDTTDKKQLYADLTKVSETVKAINNTDDPALVRELRSSLEGYENLENLVTNERIFMNVGEMSEEFGVPKAPLDDMIADKSIMNESVKATAEELGQPIVNPQQAAEVGTRAQFGQPQGNYVYNTLKEDTKNFMDVVGEMDRTFKSEKFQEGKSTMNVQEQTKIFSQPILKNIKLASAQLEAEDARELFRATKDSRPFGNQLYDYSNMLDPIEFVENLQGRTTRNADNMANLVDMARKNGDNIKANKLENVMNFEGMIKNKLDEYIAVKAGSDKPLDIGKAYYLNTLYNKQKYMTQIHESMAGRNQGFTELANNFLNDSVELDDQAVISINKSLKNIGVESRIKEAGTYSAKEYQQEIMTAFWHDVNSTTAEAGKGGGTWGKAQTFKDVAEKWGKGETFEEKLDNLAQTFKGNEREPYEIVSEIYSTVAKNKLGLDYLDDVLTDLRVDRSDIATLTKEANTIKGLDAEVRQNVTKVLEGIGGDDYTARYKPNLNVDPNNQRVNSKHLSSAVKGFFGWKFLGNLNYLKEFTGNNYRVDQGGIKLGSNAAKMSWKKAYTVFKNTVTEPIILHRDLAKTFRNIKNDTIAEIKDPKLRRKAEIFMEKRVANDPIFNSPEHLSTFGRVGAKTSEVVHKAGNIGGFGQTLSDVHRTFQAEWATINFMKSEMPNKAYNNVTPLMKNLLEANGLDEASYNKLVTRLRDMTDDDLHELVWSGKRAADPEDLKVQSLYEQFSQVFGKEFDFIENPVKAVGETKEFVEDMMMLYKRYSLGMFSNLKRSMTTVYSEKGYLESRFKWAGSGKETMKHVFKGANAGQLVNFTMSGASISLTALGVKYVTGKLSGSSEDDVAEARLDGLLQGDIAPFILDSATDMALDRSGVGLLFGGGTPLGGLIDKTAGRFERMNSAEDLNAFEKLTYFTAMLALPESAARGIDNIKFGASIPSRLTTSSTKANEAWKYNYKIQAEMEQLEATLPIEKVVGVVNPINWYKYFTSNPKAAFSVVGQSPDNVTAETAIIGATGVVETLEEQTEMAAIEEIVTDPDKADSTREYELALMGLDVKTQLSRMSETEKNTLAVIASFNNITDQAEILHIMQQLNRTKKSARKDFLRSLIEDDQIDEYRTWNELYKKRRTQIQNALRVNNIKPTTKGYIEALMLSRQEILK